MGRDLHFRSGSFYRKDDRTGFPTRAERTRMEWQGLIVGTRYWEPRQPQDLVKGVPDFQSVPDSRPLPPNQFVGPTEVSLNSAATPGQTVLQVASTFGFQVGTSVGIMLDDGTVQRTTISAPPGATSLTLAAPLRQSAAASNLVFNYSQQIAVGAPVPQ